MFQPPNSDDRSVTGWFRALQAGEDEAARRLWERYFKRLTAFAQDRLVRDAAYDGEDLALSTFDAFCRAVKEGRYDDLADREELWRLLITIATRKKIDCHRRTTAAKRTTNTNQDGATAGAVAFDMEEVEDVMASPDWQVAVEDECRHLLEMLQDSQLEQIALLKLEGHSGVEIAQQLQIGERTVKRRLAIIRKRWESELTGESH